MTAPSAARHRPTLKDVARAAQVHAGTASRALSGSQLVSQATARRVLEAARELGYIRNQAAAALRTNTTGTVGLLVPDIADPSLPGLLRGAEDVLRPAGYMMLTASTGTAPGAELETLNGMLARRVDGLIIAALTPPGPALMTSAVPCVAAGHASTWLPSAAPDLLAAAHLVTDHLAGLGHHTVACISCAGGPLTEPVILAAARAAGLSVPRRLAVTARTATVSEGRRCSRELLAAEISFTAVITSNDILAAGCLTALDAAGRPCPASVSVTGFGDLPLSGCLTPAITTIRLPYHDLGAAAGWLLLSSLGPIPQQAPGFSLLPALLDRESTAAAAPCGTRTGR